MAEYQNILVESLSKHLECAICMSSLNNPKTLHCHHAFCKDCLDDLLKFNADGSATITCPLRCEGSSMIPANQTTEQLGVMYQFKDIIDMCKEHKLKHVPATGDFCCEVCRTDVSIYCGDCNSFYCNAHETDHMSHSTKTLVYCERQDEYRPICKQHNTLGKFVCCKNVICVYCQNRSHKEHKYETFKEHADRLRQLFLDKDGSEKIESIMRNAVLNCETTKSDFMDIKGTLIKTLKNRILAHVLEQITVCEKEALKILDEYDNLIHEHMKLYGDLKPSEFLKTVTGKGDVELILSKESILKQYSTYTSPVPTLTVNLTKGNHPNVLGKLDIHAGNFVSIGSDEIQSNVISKIPEPKIVHDVERLVKKLQDLIVEVDEKLTSHMPSPTYSENKLITGPRSRSKTDDDESLEEALVEVEKRGREYLDELFTNGKENLVIEIIKAKSEVAEIRDGTGVTLLHSAAQYGFDKLSKYLLESTLIDVNVTQKFKQTPLHYAAFHNKPTCIMALLNYDADINKKNHKGNRPLDVAKQYKSADAILLLEKADEHIYEVVP